MTVPENFAMPWKIRHEGSPQARTLTLPQIVDGLRDGLWEPTDEVQGPGEPGWTAIENHPQLAEVAAELEPAPAVREDETNLDMNALIDVCLVLLIFFMMTTTYAVAVQKTVPIPSTPEDKKQQKVGKVSEERVLKYMVRVAAKLDSKGKPAIFVQGLKVDVMKADDTLDIGKLREELTKYTRSTPPRDEVMLDAKGISWGLVVSIQDAARAAGVRMIHYEREAGKE
jgi:biopolymer transport protein ExbD